MYLTDLLGKCDSVLEATSIQQDLSDKHSVGYHHGDGSEQVLQVHGELCPTSIARVQRDEDSTVEIKWNLAVVKVDECHPCTDGVLDLDDDLGEEREDLGVESVELIEDDPCTS